MLAAEAMNAAFSELKPLLEEEARAPLATIVLATVHGDIHDIGKNIVAVMLQNHGFRVVDLGRDVTVERIVESARESGAELIGLSALMTTTMREMSQVIEALRQAGLTSRVLIGGAVVTPGYAREIGADGYAKDAVSAVHEAKRLIGAE
jgi:5-methyltetrahydrofolate--homocysteine methyltransferase